MDYQTWYDEFYEGLELQEEDVQELLETGSVTVEYVGVMRHERKKFVLALTVTEDLS